MSAYERAVIELSAVDNDVDEQERETWDRLQDNFDDADEVPERFETEDLTSLPEQEQAAFIQEMALIAASDGQFEPRERRWLEDKLDVLDVSEEAGDKLLDYTSEMAEQIRENPELAAAQMISLGALGDSEDSELSDEETVKATLASIGVIAAQVGKEEAAKLAKYELQGEIANETAEKLVDTIGSEGLDAAVDSLQEWVPLGTVAGTIKEAAKGNIQDAATNAGAGLAGEGAGTIAGAAAGTAATSTAYAGFGGTLLKAGVALGLASPPAYVVWAPLAAGAVGGFAANRIFKSVFSSDD